MRNPVNGLSTSMLVPELSMVPMTLQA